MGNFHDGEYDCLSTALACSIALKWNNETLMHLCYSKQTVSNACSEWRYLPLSSCTGVIFPIRVRRLTIQWRVLEKSSPFSRLSRFTTYRQTICSPHLSRFNRRITLKGSVKPLQALIPYLSHYPVPCGHPGQVVCIMRSTTITKEPIRPNMLAI